MFTTRIRVKNRLHVMKSLMLFGGTIMKENERQGKLLKCIYFHLAPG